MKKNFLKVVALSLFAFACSDDDSDIVDPPVNPPTGGGETGQASFVINEVEYLGDRIEILNNGNAAENIGDYFLCLGPGTYAQISNLETEGDENLGAGEYLTVFYEMPQGEGGLGLYSSNQFTSADAMVDFVQWGAGNSAREDVAVTAGLWTAGEFVPVLGDENNSIIYDGEGNGVSNWSETSSVTFGADNVLTMPMANRQSIVLNEVQYGNLNYVEIYNNGDVAVDLSGFWLCLGPGAYSQIGDLTPKSGTIDLPAGEFLVLPFEMPDTEGGLGLYSTNTFASADAIVDFVQWGASGSARENVAVEAGIWTSGDFVPTVGLAASIEYDGEGEAASDWTEEAIPSLGEANDAEAKTTIFNVTISNVTNYLNVHTFSERIRTGESPTAGPLTQNGDQYQITFQAVPGTKFTPVTMMGNSNDWFLAPEDLAGISLWENGMPLDGVDIANQLILYDLGTEADNDPAYFPPAGADVGPADPNSDVRIVDRGGRRGDTYVTAVLDYEAGAADAAGTFTLTIEAIMTPQPATDRGAILSEVRYQGNDYVEILNTGSAAIDLDNYWLCLGPGRYARIGTITPVNGNINLGAGEALTLPFEMGDSEGLGLYNTNAFTNANAMVDFVQWGAAGSPRENVAVAAGLWTAGDFLPTVTAETNSIISNGIASGIDNWTETAVPSFGSNNNAGGFNNGFVVTPGIVVLHALENPLFNLGEEDRGVGLEAIAEDGNPMPLYNWFKETGSQGAPLRLASSLSVFSPGLVYAFNGERDPLVLQGETNNPNNGLEELAEDGNNAIAVSYLENLGLPVAASNETAPVGPGEDLTFTLEVPEGQNFKFGFSTMFVQTNDWFISYNNAGYPLFDENGAPVSGFGASEKSYLYDAGTEVDEAVGFGIYQAPRQTGADEGPADANTTVRRVSELNDVQFGKGLISSGPGVVWLQDPRGGYNVIRVEIQPQ